ncbi:MAG: 4'-phosphopantetheinyl transferase superfamily protein, partial [Desulfamplus sp.]|nr:4'-phosphopantetheinyl transferase superfamily protein [Desulfamplus sp.]
PLNTFYELWTRKESVVKALGTGISTNLNTFCVSMNAAVLNDTVWYTHPIMINPDYISHIAVREQHPEIFIKYISL